MSRIAFALVACAALCPAAGRCSDFFMSTQAGALFDHPVGLPPSARSLHAWNDGVGRWGESVGEQFLKLEGLGRQGFTEIKEIKNGSNNGIDRIVLKRDSRGRIQDFRLVEIKAHRSYMPKLGKGQMSRSAIARTFKAMRQSPNKEVRSLAKDLMRVQKGFGRNTDSLVEVVHVNTRTDRVVRLKYIDGKLKPYRSYSLKNLFRIVQGSPVRTERDWATRHLSEWDQIRGSRMTGWLHQQAGKVSTRAITVASQRGTQRTLSQAMRGASTTANKQLLAQAARYAGPVAMAMAVAIEAREFVDIAVAYRYGNISGRELGRRMITTAGGLGGAYLGASYGLTTGAAMGAWIGTAGGPLAWATVPVGTVVGGLVGSIAGGVAGGFAGQSAASYSANALFGGIDEEIRVKFESQFLAMAFTP